jgi:hypothetical protein
MNSENPVVKFLNNRYVSLSLFIFYIFYIGKTNFDMSNKAIIFIIIFTLFIYSPVLDFIGNIMLKKQNKYDTEKSEKKKRAQITGEKIKPGFLEEFSLKNIIIFILLIPVGAISLIGIIFLFVGLLQYLF